MRDFTVCKKNPNNIDIFVCKEGSYIFEYFFNKHKPFRKVGPALVVVCTFPKNNIPFEKNMFLILIQDFKIPQVSPPLFHSLVFRNLVEI